MNRFLGEAQPKIGLNVYLWDLDSQNRALVEAIGPTAATLRADGDLEVFWFDRNDLRGPHLFLFAIAAPGRDSRVRAVLQQAVEDFLTAEPSTVDLDDELLQARHDACHERHQSPIDAEPGFAANNTFRLFTQVADMVPLRWDLSSSTDEDFWLMLTDLTLWSIEQMKPLSSKPAITRALCWVADLDHALSRRQWAKPYWTYHLQCDVPGFKKVLAAGEQQASQMAAQKIGDNNRQTFDGIWRLSVEQGPFWQPVERFVQSAVDEHGLTGDQRWYLLREVAHTALKQMGLKVRDHILLVLFAWFNHSPKGPKEADAHV